MLGCLCICEWNQYWDTQMVKISGYSWILVPNGQGGRHGGTMVRNRTCTQVQLLVRAGQYRADQSFVPLVPTSITWHWRIPGKWQWCNCCDTVLLGIRALPIQDLKIAWDVTVCTNVADWYSQIRHWTSCRQRCLKYANLIAPYKFQPVAVQLTWADVRCYSLLPVRLRPQNFRTFRQSIWCTVLISTNQYVDPSFLLSLVPRDRQITIQVCFYISFLAPRIFSTGKKEQNIIIIIILIKLLLLSFLF